MKIPRYARTQITSDDYARITLGQHKYWAAVLFCDEGNSTIRLSRQVFPTAREAREYKRKVLERID